jgi:hypothetical protein
MAGRATAIIGDREDGGKYVVAFDVGNLHNVPVCSSVHQSEDVGAGRKRCSGHSHWFVKPDLSFFVVGISLGTECANKQSQTENCKNTGDAFHGDQSLLVIRISCEYGIAVSSAALCLEVACEIRTQVWL